MEIFSFGIPSTPKRFQIRIQVRTVAGENIAGFRINGCLGGR